MSIYQENLLFSVQGQPAYTLTEFYQLLILATGGIVSPSYFLLLETEISDCLYHLNLYIDLKNREHAKQKQRESINQLSLPDNIEYEAV